MLADSPDLESGAVQRSIGALIAELRKRGHDVLLIAPAPAGAADSSHDPDTILLPTMALPAPF